MPDTNYSTIDVSSVATRLSFGPRVLIEADAFALSVTARAVHSSDELTSDEQARLLDLLCSARMGTDISEAEPGIFVHQMVASSSRTGLVRPFVFQRVTEDNGSIVIKTEDDY